MTRIGNGRRFEAGKVTTLMVLANGLTFVQPAAAQQRPVPPIPYSDGTAASAQPLPATDGQAAPAPAEENATTAQIAAADDATEAQSAGSSRRNASAQEEIVVTGSRNIAGGLMKSQTAAITMSSITPAAIQEKLSAASPLQIANTLPGANFGSSDAYGLSIRNFLSIRGLDQTEIGFLVDNAPAVSAANYYPYTETYADNENISDITITPGNSRLQDPIINASGGEFIMSIRAPSEEFGVRGSASGGSFGAWRGFAAVETGQIGNTGFKAFASYSHSTARNYVGPGRNNKEHVDFRAEKDWSDRARSTLFVAYDDLFNARIPLLNRVQALDGIKNDRLETYAFSPTYTPGVTAQYFRINPVLTKNLVISNNNDFELSDSIKLHITPYYRYNDTNGAAQSRILPTSIFSGNTKVTAVVDPASLQGGAIVTASNTHYDQNIVGVSGYIDAQLSKTNQLTFGYWFQDTVLHYRQYLEQVDQQGNFPGYSESTALRTATGDLITGQYDRIGTTTHQFFVGDTQSLFDDRLTLTVGIKQLYWKANVDNFVIGTFPHTSVSWSRSMPRILGSFKIDDHNQLYANVTTNTRMPLPQATYVTTFNVTTGVNSAVANTAIKPEYTTSTQLGYRFSGVINLDIAAFHMKLKNHQVQGTQYVNGFLRTTALEAGGETIKGVSVEAATKSFHGFSLYGNAQYLHATFDDNLPLRGDFLPNKGKKIVLAPAWMTNAGARFDSGGFYATVAHKYVGRQYSTFMNDETIPHINTFDAGIGYRFDKVGFVKSPVIRLSVTNISDKSYISTLAAPATNAVAVRGVNGTLLPAGTPTYYVAAPRAAVLTIGAEF